MYNKEIFLNNVNFLCDQQEIRKSELEKEVGISSGYLSRLEKEEDVAPKINLVDAIAQKLGVDIDTLISVTLKDMDPEIDKVLHFIKKILADTYAGICVWQADEDTPHGKHKPGIHKRRDSPYDKYYEDNVYYAGMAYQSQLANGMELYLLPLTNKKDVRIIELFSIDGEEKYPICTSVRLGGSSLLHSLYNAIVGFHDDEEINSSVKAKMDEYLSM